MDEAVKKLVELLDSPTQAIKIPALRSLGNLLTGNDEQTQLIISYGVLHQFATLLDSSQKGIRKEVAWSISNITAGTEEQIQAVIDANLFPKLIEIISNESAVGLKKEAIWACTNALKRGSLAQIQYLIELGIVISFCDALTSDDHGTLIVVLKGLVAIFKAAKEMENCLKVVHIIESCGGVQKLELLKEHSNVEVVSAALTVLDFIKEEDKESDVATV